MHSETVKRKGGIIFSDHTTFSRKYVSWAWYSTNGIFFIMK